MPLQESYAAETNDVSFIVPAVFPVCNAVSRYHRNICSHKSKEREISMVSVSLCCLQIPDELEIVGRRNGDTPIPGQALWIPACAGMTEVREGVKRGKLWRD